MVTDEDGHARPAATTSNLSSMASTRVPPGAARPSGNIAHTWTDAASLHAGDHFDTPGNGRALRRYTAEARTYTD